jgi:hypothetical protein
MTGNPGSAPERPASQEDRYPGLMAEETEHVVTCHDCGATLDEAPSTLPENRQPCPSCGSLARHVMVTVGDAVTAHASIALKAKSPGEKRPFTEQKHGDSFSPKRGRWMQLMQIVDRRNNRYRKRVRDPETGEVLRDVDKPLTEHVGHGDARPKRRRRG